MVCLETLLCVKLFILDAFKSQDCNDICGVEIGLLEPPIPDSTVMCGSAYSLLPGSWK